MNPGVPDSSVHRRPHRSSPSDSVRIGFCSTTKHASLSPTSVALEPSPVCCPAARPVQDADPGWPLGPMPPCAVSDTTDAILRGPSSPTLPPPASGKLPRLPAPCAPSIRSPPLTSGWGTPPAGRGAARSGSASACGGPAGSGMGLAGARAPRDLASWRGRASMALTRWSMTPRMAAVSMASSQSARRHVAIAPGGRPNRDPVAMVAAARTSQMSPSMSLGFEGASPSLWGREMRR